MHEELSHNAYRTMMTLVIKHYAFARPHKPLWIHKPSLRSPPSSVIAPIISRCVALPKWSRYRNLTLRKLRDKRRTSWGMLHGIKYYYFFVYLLYCGRLLLHFWMWYPTNIFHMSFMLARTSSSPFIYWKNLPFCTSVGISLGDLEPLLYAMAR